MAGAFWLEQSAGGASETPAALLACWSSFSEPSSPVPASLAVSPVIWLSGLPTADALQSLQRPFMVLQF